MKSHATQNPGCGLGSPHRSVRRGGGSGDGEEAATDCPADGGGDYRGLADSYANPGAQTDPVPNHHISSARPTAGAGSNARTRSQPTGHCDRFERDLMWKNPSTAWQVPSGRLFFYIT